MRHKWALFAGVLLLAVAWSGPATDMARASFTGHMALHLFLIAGVAPVIATGLHGTRVEARLAGLAILNPILLSVAELIVVWAWHAPALHAASREVASIFIAERISFVMVGTLFWLSVIGGSETERYRTAFGVFALLLTSMHMALLGTLLNLAPRPLYLHHGNPTSALLADQQFGGLLMLIVGGTVYLVAGLWLLLRLLKQRSDLVAISETELRHLGRRV